MKTRYVHCLALATVLMFGTVAVAAAAGKKETPRVSKNHRDKKPSVKSGRPGSFAKAYKLDAELTRRSKGLLTGLQTSSVIVTLEDGKTEKDLPNELLRYIQKRNLGIINGQVLELPNRLLKKLVDESHVVTIHENRGIEHSNYRTAVTTGARAVNEIMGLTGAGVGVAVIDSGISAFHDDLTVKNSSTLYPYGNQRVAKFVDFVNGRTLPYDDNGHGSHVAGIVGGNGSASAGSASKAGMAPKASVIALKVLDANGAGTIADVIEALNWVYVNRTAYNIRVVNLSVGAPIRESYWTDPLTLAAKKLTDLGIVVVVAAGNRGKNGLGVAQYGGITSPANAPWVLTVGASSTQGTLTRNDDIMATYSSRGPTYLDWSAKPDLVAPGTATVSLAVSGSTLYKAKPLALVSGLLSWGTKPYLALSGTSMAAPAVSGTVALMFQANPNLTPNLVKAILQYTAQVYPGYDALTQGAGFLNTLGAVRLAQFYATAHKGDHVPVQSVWSRHVIWGNHMIKGGLMVPSKNAWGNKVVWGSAKTLGFDGDNIIWGTFGDGDNIIWGTAAGTDIIWGTAAGSNIIWGTSVLTDIIWGTSFDGDNIIWGTSLADNIIWGTDCGGADCDNTIWGSSDIANIIWGTAQDGDNIIWGTSDLANIIWGTSGAEDVPVFPEENTAEPPPSLDLEFGDVLPIGGV